MHALLQAGARLAYRDFLLLVQYACLCVSAPEAIKHSRDIEPVAILSCACLLCFEMSNKVCHESNQLNKNMVMPCKLLLLLTGWF